jgi:predicted small metal-binding protein
MGEITVRCVCGWESTGGTDEVVAATTEHGRRVHNMVATREQVLAMAVDPANEPTDASRTGAGDPPVR